MHGPTCIFWANLTPLSLKLERFEAVAFIESPIFQEDAAGSASHGRPRHLRTALHDFDG